MQRRLVGFLSLLASFIAFTSVTTYYWPIQRLSFQPSGTDYEQWTNSSASVDSSARLCQIPKLSPWHKSVLPLIEHPRKVVCRRVQPDLTYLDEEGVLHLNLSAVRESQLEEQERLLLADVSNISCQYSYFDRGRVDREIVFGPDIALMQEVRLERNFVRVTCNVTVEAPAPINHLVYANLHAHPAPLENENRSDLSQNGNDLNVFLFLLESASASMVHRHLPSTLSYFTNTMNGFVFDSVLKVGENTLPNLAALFTGRRLRNEQPNMQPELKQASTNGGYYDHWPFIWRRFSEEAGYTTTYMEDLTKLGTFHYSGDGFREKPVDYWYFPYLEAMRLLQLPKKSSKFCFGNTPMYKVFIDILTRHLRSTDWIRRKQFFFAAFSDLSHDYVSDLERADDTLKEFLQTMYENGILNRTLFVLAGDHGPRFTSIRSTEAGFVEERVPFFGLWLPSWFRQLYPEADRSLKLNQHRLISLFDLHETLIDVMKQNYPASGRDYQPAGARGLSLFRPVPLNRTCFDAGVPDRYCLCDGITIEALDHPLANRSAKLILNAAQNVTRKYRTQCVRLRVEKLIYFILVGQQDAEETLRVYFAAFRTAPLGAVFEGAVLYNSSDSTLRYQEGTLERINGFGVKGRCVPTVQLKKFCACKEDVTRARKVK